MRGVASQFRRRATLPTILLDFVVSTLLMCHAPVGTTQAAVPKSDRVRVVEQPRGISDIALTNHDGEAFRLSQLRGNVVLVFFGFTNCPDVCPAAMGKFQTFAASERVDTDEVSFVLVSVDGKRDTPPVMKEYLVRFSPGIIGLTGEPETVRKLAKAFSASFFKGEETGADGSYSMMHSPQMFVLDRNGDLRAELYDPPVDVMANVVQALLTESD